MTAIPKAVASAIAPSTAASVPILTEPQLGPYKPMNGNPQIPIVPKTEVEGEPNPNPYFGGTATSCGTFEAGSLGAPSVPVDGYLFRARPIDEHYTSMDEERSPYAKVNNPPTRGMFTRIQDFLNGIATSQDVDNAGWKARHPQQRTSHMRNQLPPTGNGFILNWFTPRQNPQSPNWNRIQPSIGTDPYGTGVLNSDTYGAGQTAGGVGGSNYTPFPGPPSTNNAADNAPISGEPTWG